MRSLFSQSWYRVAPLKPRLRGHAEIHRQRFRGEVWYILQDHQTGRFHRLSPTANLVVCLMDGRRTLQAIWDHVASRNEDDPPTQDETIQLLSQLHATDLLEGAFPPDFSELLSRADSTSRRTMIARIRNPLALRFPLFDPDPWLDRLRPLYGPLFSWFGLVAWLALVIAGVTVAALHWGEATGDIANQMLTAQNVLLILCIYPVVKALHEAGHACATKAWGGEVHEVGIMILVFIPAPYVDASSSTAFISKWQRAVVSSAGILIEMALAAAAALVWASAEPGLVRAAAFNVMVIGSVSTLLFNGNPLLRFDGYYILADLLEIPNLAARANRYVFYLVQRYVFALDGVTSPVTAKGERGWLLFYAVGSFFYRVTVSLAIATFVATQFFVFGVALAIVSIAGIVVFPLLKGIKYLASDSRLQGRRARAIRLSAGATAVLLLALFAVPLPYATMAQGVVWVPDQSELRARTDGILSTFLTEPGRQATPGMALTRLEDPSLAAKVGVLGAQLQELLVRHEAARLVDRVQAEILQEQIGSAQQTLTHFRARLADLTVTSDREGRFVVPGASDMPGRYIRRGDRIGFVLGADDPVVRVVVPQSDVDLVGGRPGAVAARFAGSPALVREASIRRAVPGSQTELPSLALSTQGGGPIALDTSNAQKPTALQSFFIFDVQIAGGIPLDVIGERVFVRFDHGREAVGWRILRDLRQTFLSHFRV